MGNSFGNIFKLTSFGESHGLAIGGVIDGCPANITLNLNKIQNQLDRRRPGQSKITTQRKESDTVEFLSGIFEGKTTGTPIGFIIKNEDQKSKDYNHIKDVFRPSHADFTYSAKYGNRDYRGGGRSSARETAVRVVAGAVAEQVLNQLYQQDVKIKAYVSKIGNLEVQNDYSKLNLDLIDSNIVRCPDPIVANNMIEYVETIKKAGDTIGGQITCVVKNVPIALGNPVFGKLNANLAGAMFSINAVKGFELGSGFDAINMKGSEHNDLFTTDKGKVKTQSNFSGGIQGGISNGEDIYFNVAFKPIATLIQKQTTINEALESVEMMGKGRHDPCVVPRAVPIVEAMTALVLLDAFLMNRAQSNL